MDTVLIEGEIPTPASMHLPETIGAAPAASTPNARGKLRSNPVRLIEKFKAEPPVGTR